VQTPHFSSAVVVRRNYHCTVVQCRAASTLAATLLPAMDLVSAAPTALNKALG
jgi:hypothetical protein